MQYCSLLKPLLWRWIFPVPLLLQAHTPCRCFFFLHTRAKSKGQVRGRGQTVALYPNRNPVCPVCFPVSALPGPHMDYCKTGLSHVIFIPIRSKKDPYLFNVLKKEKKRRFYKDPKTSQQLHKSHICCDVVQHEGRWPILCRAKVSPLPSLLCCNTRVRLSALCLRRDIVKRLWNQIKEHRWRHQWQLDAANNKKKKWIKSFLGMSCVPLVLQSANANSSQEPVQYDSKHPDVPDVSVPERSPLKCPSALADDRAPLHTDWLIVVTLVNK